MIMRRFLYLKNFTSWSISSLFLSTLSITWIDFFFLKTLSLNHISQIFYFSLGVTIWAGYTGWSAIRYKKVRSELINLVCWLALSTHNPHRQRGRLVRSKDISLKRVSVENSRSSEMILTQAKKNVEKIEFPTENLTQARKFCKKKISQRHRPEFLYVS